MSPYRKSFTRLSQIAIASALAISAFPVFADSAEDEIKALREEIQALDQKLRVLERKQELATDDQAAAAKTAPKVTVSDRSFGISSADGATSIRFRGLVQLDSRLFFGDHGAVNNTFVLRRARPILEGSFANNYSFQFVPDFGGSSVVIQDANFSINLNKSVQVKVGKFKAPVGLELLQSDSNLYFAERSLVTNLVPNRDLGVQVSGDILKGTVNYTAGIFNGQPDAGSTTTNADVDNDKDFIGRVYTTPFKASLGSPLQGLSFGVAGSLGREKSTSARASAYKTDGQQTFFSYLANATADGQSWRVSPQLDYRYGPLGVTGEYVLSTVNLRPSAGASKIELQNKAWQLSAGYVVTGEDSSFNGITPKVNFNLNDGTWGALELVARYAQLKIDDNAFPLLASAAASADGAKSFGVGANWYVSKTIRIMFDFFQTKFDFNASAPAQSTTAILRQDEKAFFTRFQISF